MPAVVGTCISFCPTAEARLRKSSGGVSDLESIATDSQWPLIKWYSRSAAGAIVETHDVRPLHVLLRVVEHILHRVISRNGWRVSAAFASDRLRAVRVDAYMQEFSGGAWARALVAQLRFHAALSLALLRTTSTSTRVRGESGLSMIENDARIEETGNDAWAALRFEAAQEMVVRESEVTAVVPLAVVGWNADALTLFLEVQSLRLASSLATRFDAPGGLRAMPLIAETAPFAAAAAAAAVRRSSKGSSSSGDTAIGVLVLWRALVNVAKAWHSGARWSEFLTRVDTFPRGSCREGMRASELIRGILARCVPYARAGVLAAFNDAILSRLSFPASALATQLRIRDGGKQQPAWLHAAQFAVRLGVGIRDAEGVRIVGDNAHAALQEIIVNGNINDVSLAFDKSKIVTQSCGNLGEINFEAIEKRLALTPRREEGGGQGGLAEVCESESNDDFTAFLFWEMEGGGGGGGGGKKFVF
jgi:hypothetical protein